MVSPVRAGPAIATCALAVATLLSACGGGGSGGNAVDLTKRLPHGADSYVVADLTKLREDLGLPEDADPLAPKAGGDPAFTELAGPSFDALTRQLPAPGVLGALDLGAVRAAALATTGGEGVAVLSTDADTGDVGSNLGDLGYRDRGGILTGDGSGPSFHLEPGLIFVSGDPGRLRQLPDEPSDQLPATLLGEVDGDVIASLPGLADCSAGVAASAGADGDGELALLIDGGADAGRLRLADSSAVSFGDPAVDGDLITVPVSSGSGGFAAYRALTLLLVAYDCG